MFTNKNISHIVSYNYNQIFEVWHLITLLKSYAAQIWSQPNFGLSMIKYEVTLPLVVKKLFFYF
jgi:hypothetical protein